MEAVRTLRDRHRRDVEASVDDAHVVARHGVFLVSRLAKPGAIMVFPVMPRADQVVAVEAPLSERATGVVADTGERTEVAVPVCHDDSRGPDPSCCQRRRRKTLDGAEVAPIRLGCHDIVGCGVPISGTVRRFREFDCDGRIQVRSPVAPPDSQRFRAGRPQTIYVCK
jgi:hypothetical protein